MNTNEQEYSKELSKYADVLSYLESYINLSKESKKINARRPNFPECISQYQAKFAIYNYIGIFPTDKGDGDIRINKNFKIEVKAFSSDGPISFGPTENWKWLIFVDAIEYEKDFYKIYLLKENNFTFGQILVNQNETFNYQASFKRRPRIKFEKIMNQKKDLELLFCGSFNELINKKNVNLYYPIIRKEYKQSLQLDIFDEYYNFEYVLVYVKNLEKYIIILNEKSYDKEIENCENIKNLYDNCEIRVFDKLGNYFII